MYRLLCKIFHKKHHVIKIWDDGLKKEKEIYCNKCKQYFNNSFYGGSCWGCNCALKSAHFTQLCSVCRNKPKVIKRLKKDGIPLRI